MAYGFITKPAVNITLATYADVVPAALSAEYEVWLRVYNRGADNSIIIGKSAAGEAVADVGSYPYQAGETRVIGPFGITTTGGTGKIQAKLAAAGDMMVTPEGASGP